MTTRTYQNFDLLITRTSTSYSARVISAPAGQANIDFVLPFTQEEVRNLFWLSARALRNLDLVEEHGERPALTVRDFGVRLYGAIFAGSVGRCFAQSIVLASGDLRIRLRLGDVPALADLPWEFLYAPELDRHLTLSAQTPVVRYFDLPLAEQSLTVQPPLRILTIVSAPAGAVLLDVEQEWQQLQVALADLQGRNLVWLERLPSATPTALQARLRQHQTPIHILHFIGHGDFDPAQEAGALLLSDDANQPLWLSAERLGALLHDHASLRLVFLNACEGARGGHTNAFGGVAQKLLQQGIPAVLAMQFAISDQAALTLAREFYSALAAGYPVDAAVSEARKALYVAGDEREWGTPVLFSRSADNQLLTPDLPAVMPKQSTAVTEIHTGGGMVVQGNVTSGGDFVGRDQITIVVQRPEDALPLQRRAAVGDGTLTRLPFEPETVLIPRGPFVMGHEPRDGIPASETPMHHLTLPDFRIGKYPVTVREFAAFVKATKAVEWANTAREAGWFDLEPPQALLDHPVTGVSWYDALTYCKWLSSQLKLPYTRQYTLPSEAEWEKAASWTTDEYSHLPADHTDLKRRYPWGAVWREGCCNTGQTMTTPVTAHPSGASAYGCEDLLGNVQEWTRSLWGSQPQQPTYGYPYKLHDNREVVKAEDLPVQARLVHRGGSYNAQPADLRCTARGHATPNSRVAWRGFRIVILLDSEAQEI